MNVACCTLWERSMGKTIPSVLFTQSLTGTVGGAACRVGMFTGYSQWWKVWWWWWWWWPVCLLVLLKHTSDWLSNIKPWINHPPTDTQVWTCFFKYVWSKPVESLASQKPLQRAGLAHWMALHCVWHQKLKLKVPVLMITCYSKCSHDCDSKAHHIHVVLQLTCADHTLTSDPRAVQWRARSGTLSDTEDV